MKFRVLVINPGSTSTKLAVMSEEGPLVEENVLHTGAWVTQLKTVAQLDYRKAAVLEFLSRHGFDVRDLDAVVGRGGLLRPLSSGTYLVNDAMIEDLRNEVGGSHASNMGGLLAASVARPYGLPAFVVDPVSVDEYWDYSRISGLPCLPRKSLLHALNMKQAARKAARELGRDLEDLFLVIAHLGSGFSVSPCYHGRLVDANNSNEEGPFTVERAGTLPSRVILRLCREIGEPRRVRFLLISEAGMFGYLGTKDAREVEKKLSDPKWALVYRAMAYQVAREIGAMASVAPEMPDAVVITGGLARSQTFIDVVKERTSFIGPHLVYPGEDEMACLAQGAIRVLSGEEQAREYPERGRTV
ncbi:MAG TPA: butyrate kinase [Firmicutes bacterium]|nr:butyrate kinase [Candidatus Fermentithermobacillaceae bacterium]